MVRDANGERERGHRSCAGLNGLPQPAGRMPAIAATTPVLNLVDAPGCGHCAPRSRPRRELGAGAVSRMSCLVAHELASNARSPRGGSGRLRLWRDDYRVLPGQRQRPRPGGLPPRPARLPSPQVPGGSRAVDRPPPGRRTHRRRPPRQQSSPRRCPLPEAALFQRTRRR